MKRVYIEITNICNLSCPFCVKTNRDKKIMSINDFEKVVQKVSAEKPQIYLHILGEPLLVSNLKDYLDIIGKYGLLCNITTNGTLIDKHFDLLLDHKAVRKVSFSIHSLGDVFDNKARDYLDKILSFSKATISENRLIINFRMWTGGDDFLAQENMECVRYIKSAFGGEIENSYVDGYHSIKLYNNIYIVYDKKFEWPSEDSDQKSEYGKCLGLKQMLGVLVDGTVVPCCLDYNGSIGLGNLFYDSLDDIKKSSRYQSILKAFSGGKITEDLCRKCSYRLRFDKRRNKNATKEKETFRGENR